MTLLPTGKLTVSLIFPLPLAAQVALPAPEQVHEIPLNLEEKLSVTVAPDTF